MKLLKLFYLTLFVATTTNNTMSQDIKAVRPLVRYASNIPTQVVFDSSYQVVAIIAKDSIEGPLEYTTTGPKGFYIKDVDAGDAFINNQVHSLILEWKDVPTENIAIRYTLVTERFFERDTSKESVISTKIEYKKNKKNKMDVFNHLVVLSVKQFAEKNVAVDSIFSSDIVLVYRVQIAASKGRPCSIAKLASKYGVSESDITETLSKSMWYQYSIGAFSTLADAKIFLKKIKKINKSAYIIKK